MTLKEAIRLLSRAGICSAAHDAREIFRHFDGYDASCLISNPDTVASKKAEQAVMRRAGREPLQYIIGEVIFYNESYRVSPDCLIPRPDTELLVEYAVKHIPTGARFIDLCTGSGCIAISTLSNTDGTSAVAVDFSENALLIAKENAERNRVSDRLEFINADLLKDGSLAQAGSFYAVLSNPPYIEESVYEELEPELLHEPKIALVAENDGKIFYDKLLPLGLSIIEDGGFVAFEIGYDQAEHLNRLASLHGANIEIIKDYSGNDRVAVLRKRG